MINTVNMDSSCFFEKDPSSHKDLIYVSKNKTKNKKETALLYFAKTQTVFYF